MCEVCVCVCVCVRCVCGVCVCGVCVCVVCVHALYTCDSVYCFIYRGPSRQLLQRSFRVCL